MNKKALLIILSVVLLIVGFIIYEVFNYKININVTTNSIKVNLYDNINVRNYLSSVKDNRGRNLYDNVKIDVESDDQDILTGDTLYIGGIGSKVINYIVENNGITASKSIVVNVITDPSDKDFNPNYENMQKGINEYDTGDGEMTDTNLTESQIEYLKKYRSE